MSTPWGDIQELIDALDHAVTHALDWMSEFSDLGPEAQWFFRATADFVNGRVAVINPVLSDLNAGRTVASGAELDAWGAAAELEAVALPAE